jgi:hypothetical protein
MSDPKSILDDGSNQTVAERISEVLKDIVSYVPQSQETVSDAPSVRVQTLADNAVIKAALVSAGMAVVPGPMGILTIIPALIKIWQIQRQMVADIAACYGKTAFLSPEMMLYCLFRHGSATIFKETVIQIGGRLLIRETSLRVIQQLIQRVSINVTQRVISQFVSRWLPIAGSAAIGAFTFWDTKRIAKTAIATFEKDIDIDHETPPIAVETPNPAW